MPQSLPNESSSVNNPDRNRRKTLRNASSAEADSLSRVLNRQDEREDEIDYDEGEDRRDDSTNHCDCSKGIPLHVAEVGQSTTDSSDCPPFDDLGQLAVVVRWCRTTPAGSSRFATEFLQAGRA